MRATECCSAVLSVLSWKTGRKDALVVSLQSTTSLVRRVSATSSAGLTARAYGSWRFLENSEYEDFEDCELSMRECLCGAVVLPQVVGSRISEVGHEHSGVQLGTQAEECGTD